jgi:hypothetical protein
MGDFKPLSQEARIRRGWFPNQVLYDRKASAVEIVLQRSTGGDYALSAKALFDNAEAIQNGNLTEGHVVLNGNRIPLLVMADKLGSCEPLQGKFGLFWWLDTESELAGSELADAPFPDAPRDC